MGCCLSWFKTYLMEKDFVVFDDVDDDDDDDDKKTPSDNCAKATLLTSSFLSPSPLPTTTPLTPTPTPTPSPLTRTAATLKKQGVDHSSSELSVDKCAAVAIVSRAARFPPADVALYNQMRGRYKLSCAVISTLYGTLYRAEDTKRNNAKVAIKVSYAATMEIKTRTHQTGDDLEREVEMLKKLQNQPGFVQLVQQGNNRSCHWLVMEWLDGIELVDFGVELHRRPAKWCLQQVNHLAIREKFPWADTVIKYQAALCWAQIVRRVASLHEQHIAHCDLSPENIMLNCSNRNDEMHDTKQPEIVIIDFGSARMLENDGFGTDDDRTRRNMIRTSALGKHSYRTPQQFAGEYYDPRHSDWFACAVILFLLFSNYMPFKIAHASDKHYAMIKKGKLYNLVKILSLLDCFPPDALQLIQNMLHFEPKHRLCTADSIVSHPWTQTCFQLERFLFVLQHQPQQK